MFAGSDPGRTAALLLSLTASCKDLRIELFAYFRDQFSEYIPISNPKAEHLDHWPPDVWKQRNAKTETRSNEE